MFGHLNIRHVRYLDPQLIRTTSAKRQTKPKVKKIHNSHIPSFFELQIFENPNRPNPVKLIKCFWRLFVLHIVKITVKALLQN